MRVKPTILPNTLTLVNLIAGFTAIIFISEANYQFAALALLIAGIFDMLDGLLARFMNASSKFGIELDSLCDVVSFGIAPSFMLYKIYFHSLGFLGILAAALTSIAAVIRLARFNISAGAIRDKKYFQGLPVPASAIALVSYMIFFWNNTSLNPELKITVLYIITIGVSAAMVSRIPYPNVPKPTISYIRDNSLMFSFYLTGSLASVFTSGMFIFPFMLLYIAGNALNHFVGLLSKNSKHRKPKFKFAEEEKQKIQI